MFSSNSIRGDALETICWIKKDVTYIYSPFEFSGSSIRSSPTDRDLCFDKIDATERTVKTGNSCKTAEDCPRIN